MSSRMKYGTSENNGILESFGLEGTLTPSTFNPTAMGRGTYH